MAYVGVIIEESLDEKKILNDKRIKIISTEVEKVTQEHKTPWLNKWTLHKVEIDEENAEKIVDLLSTSLDKIHNWYADFRNNKYHFIVFKKKIFVVNLNRKEEYRDVIRYGLKLGIPEYQVDFHPEVEKWER
jgi:hypothetical protein